MLGYNKDLFLHLNGYITILCHINADPDAICASFALKKLLKKIPKVIDVEIVLSSGASELSRKLIKLLEISVNEESSFEEHDVLIIVDSGNLEQIDKWKKKVEKGNETKIIIDHHVFNEELQKIATLYIHDEASSSTCEMIYQIFLDNKIPLNHQIAKALVTGILYDSRHLTIASSTTLRIVSELLEYNISLPEITEMLYYPLNFSEKIARLKSAQRAKIIKFNNLLFVTSELSSFQSSAARSLIRLGADLAIVTGKKDNNIKSSLRSTNKFHQKTGIHLGKLVSSEILPFKGVGNGHATAAGFNGEGSIENYHNEFINIVKSLIGNAM